MGGQIPDFVSIGFKGYPEEIPWPRSWSYRHSFVTWLLRQQPRISAEAVAQHAFETPERTNPIIRDLIRSGAVIQSQGGYLELASAIAAQQAEVIAIEAKLKRWKQALEQARNYKRFANVVVVAMDPDGIPRSPDSKRVFRQSGIGLCAVARGAVEWLVRPSLLKGPLGPESEYLIRSATASDRQALWSWRKPVKASLHA